MTSGGLRRPYLKEDNAGVQELETHLAPLFRGEKNWISADSGTVLFTKMEIVEVLQNMLHRDDIFS